MALNTEPQKALDEKGIATQIESVSSNPDLEEVGKHAKVVKTQDSRFAAVIARNKPNPLSKSLLLLYPILFVAFMNSAANGFDGNTFGGVSAVPDFQARFGTNVASSNGFLAGELPHPRSLQISQLDFSCFIVYLNPQIRVHITDHMKTSSYLYPGQRHWFLRRWPTGRLLWSSSWHVHCQHRRSHWLGSASCRVQAP
jgi:hypothetical protein